MGKDRKIIEREVDGNRLARADRAAVLVDAATYYGALRKALLNARKSVFIVGWDINSQTRLVGPSGEPDDDLPAEFGPFLSELVKRQPDVRIKILLWDYSILYAAERELLPQVNLDWKTPKQISICLDDQLPFGSAHHEKCVVIDDTMAFLGGIDITIRRWDTPKHEMENDKRADPSGSPYRPFHDIQMVFDGKAAETVSQIVRERWRRAACETPPPIDPCGDPWPEGTEPDLADVEIALACTLPAEPGQEEIREVESLYCAHIRDARHCIYIESQYLTAARVAAALAESLQKNPELQVVIVSPNIAFSWLEEYSMSAGRFRFMNHLRDAGVLDRVRLVYPAIPGDESEQGVMVHAKCMIVDDRVLRIGSANLNNRSMGTDTECDAVIEAENDAQRQGISQIRNRLLAEHLGVGTDEVDKAWREAGSLFGAIDNLKEGPRTLKPIDWQGTVDDEVAATVSQIADPERPIPEAAFIRDFVTAEPKRRSPTRVIKAVAVVLGVLGLVALWRFTPLSDLIDPETLVREAHKLGSDTTMPLIVAAMFVVGGLVAFPVTVLIAATGMLFTPLLAFAVALVSSILSALIAFGLGRRMGMDPLRRFLGTRINKIDRALAHQGIASVAAVRMLPVAPFTLINLGAGASRISILDFTLGSILGMAPGVAILCLLGRQFAETLANPEPHHIALFAGGLLAWLGLGLGCQVLVKKLRTGKHD